MNRYPLLLICVAATLLAACANDTQIVRALAAKELKCAESELIVTAEKRQTVSTSHYNVSGCNRTRAYVCDRWSNGVAAATTGDTSLTPMCQHVF